jgi:hypothetical protein
VKRGLVRAPGGHLEIGEGHRIEVVVGEGDEPEALSTQLDDLADDHIARALARGRNWRSVIAIIASLVAALTVAYSALLWIETQGVKSVSPFIGENLHEIHSLPTYIFVSMIVVIAVTALTYRFIGKNDAPAVWTTRRTYANEHWMVALLAALPLVGGLAEALLAVVSSPGLLASMLIDAPQLTLLITVSLAGVSNLYQTIKHRRAPAVERHLLQSPGLFCFVWMCLGMIVLAAGPLLLWSSFAAWVHALPRELLHLI